MTIFFPDVSEYQKNLKIQPGTVAVMAKSSEGTTGKDPCYGYFKEQAASVGALFSGYHFLHHGSIAAQAENAFSQNGTTTPVMWDVEKAGSSVPTIDDLAMITDEYRALGGICTVSYLPEWYLSSLGNPSLQPLVDRGLHLISSNYEPYSDEASGWNPYGGMTPSIWQFTDSFSYGGMKVDFNAYKGSVNQLAALWGLSGTGVPEGATAASTDYPEGFTGTSQYRAGHNVFTPLSVDGDFGFASWKALQYVLGVNPDGIAGPATITALQENLKKTYPSIAVDGKLGKETITFFQEKLLIVPDGNWGQQTSRTAQSDINHGWFF